MERVEPYRVSKDESTDAEVDAGLAEITESAELTEMDTESRQTEVQAAEVSDTEITEVSQLRFRQMKQMQIRHSWTKSARSCAI